MTFDVKDLLPNVDLEDSGGGEVPSETRMTWVDCSCSSWGWFSTEEERDARGMEEDFGKEWIPDGEGRDVEIPSGVKLKGRKVRESQLTKSKRRGETGREEKEEDATNRIYSSRGHLVVRRDGEELHGNNRWS